ncbi:MAG: cation diffusion facilitator family transporter [Candidatus Coprovivens sp.]
MTKEGRVLITSMLINFMVSFLKIITGFICQSKSMVADGFHSLSDFITDIVALFGSKFSQKRANKKHPDGYGRFEYITDIFIATTILLLGVYSIYNAFVKEPTTTNVMWIIVVIFTIILKVINSNYLLKKGTEYKSPILITSSKESYDDAISSLGVIIIIVISQFQEQIPLLKYTDTIGSIIIGLSILHTGYGIMKENIAFLLGETEDNKEIEKEIKNILQLYQEIDYKDMDLERHGSYYVLELEVYVLKNIKVYKLLTIESEIKRKIKKLNYKIKFVDINLYHHSEEKTIKE